jgi:hypothetical protein
VDWGARLAGGRDIVLVAGDQIALWSLDGKRLTKPIGLENYSLGVAVAGAKDEVIVAAERAGWIDLYTKDGKFNRRVQSGGRDRRGFVALSADGNMLAALGPENLSVMSPPGTRASGAALTAQDSGPLVAVAANGSRIVAEGPDKTLRSWSKDGAEADSILLSSGGQAPARRLSGLAVSTNGDAVAAAEDGSALWLAHPANKNVVRVALAARSVAPFPDGTGFAVGLADGTVARISRDGTVRQLPFKVSELGVGRIVVAPDGQSFVAIEDDERQARHFAWDGRVLAGPYRAETISDAFFREGAPRLILRHADPTADERYTVVTLASPR